MKFHNDILGLIGNTPLVRINNITKEQKIKAPIYAKMESLNPGYSVKDRIGISMIDWAEKEGVLKKGGTIIEATSGNTQIFDAVRHLADREGLSVLLLEQNVGQALRIVDRVYVMRSGRVILHETVEEMRARDSYWDLF